MHWEDGNAISLTFLSELVFEPLDDSDKCHCCHWLSFNYTWLKLSIAAAAANLISWSLEHELAGGFPNSIRALGGEVTMFKSLPIGRERSWLGTFQSLKIIDPFKLTLRTYYTYIFVFQVNQWYMRIGKINKRKRKRKQVCLENNSFSMRTGVCMCVCIYEWRPLFKKTTEQNGTNVSITPYKLNICFQGINDYIFYFAFPQKHASASCDIKLLRCCN